MGGAVRGMGATLRAWQKLVQWWKQREPLPMDQVSQARQINANKAEIAALKTRLADCESRTAAAIAQQFAIMDRAAKAAGLSHPDLETTMPRGLYAVPDERQAG